MEVFFRTQKMQIIFCSEQKLKAEYGDNARLIMRRLKEMEAVNCLAEISHKPPSRRHKLIGNRKNQFAVDLKYPYRLVFEPIGNDLNNEDGALDLFKVKSIKIIEVVDYHD